VALHLVTFIKWNCQSWPQYSIDIFYIFPYVLSHSFCCTFPFALLRTYGIQLTCDIGGSWRIPTVSATWSTSLKSGYGSNLGIRRNCMASSGQNHTKTNVDTRCDENLKSNHLEWNYLFNLTMALFLRQLIQEEQRWSVKTSSGGQGNLVGSCGIFLKGVLEWQQQCGCLFEPVWTKTLGFEGSPTFANFSQSGTPHEGLAIKCQMNVQVPPKLSSLKQRFESVTYMAKKLGMANIT
jgi:hypothetical protein